MNDETKAAHESLVELREWACKLNQLARHSDDGMANSCIAADNQRAIWVKVKTLLAHIDGEPARLAAAREEVREACARDGVEHFDTWDDIDQVAARVRATPLDATPQADELRTLRARVAELEEYKQEGDDVAVAAYRLRFWEENPYACPVHFGARTACGQCYDSERTLRLAAEAKRDFWKDHAEWAEAQVAAARAVCERARTTGDVDEYGLATDVLRAMDEAAKGGK